MKTTEDFPIKKKRAIQILNLFKQHYPDAHCALNYQNPFQLLIATILSAQCTDVRVNLVTPELFRQFPDAVLMAKANLKTLEKLIHSTGFFRNKARNISNCSNVIATMYNNQVPASMDDLTSLPGVGRKTANVVLGNAFGIPGTVVDTHVIRLSKCLDLVSSPNPLVIEKEIDAMIPYKQRTFLSHAFTHHGRNTCKARKPFCEGCFLLSLCPQNCKKFEQNLKK